MKTRFAVTLLAAALAALCAVPAAASAPVPSSRSAHGRVAAAPKAHTVYVCVQDGYVSRTPGTCPKCDKPLKKMDSRNIYYSCPMHKDVVAEKPGRCPKCGMYLKMHVKEKKNKSHTVSKKG